MDAQLKAGATFHKNTLFAEFGKVILLPDAQPKYDRVAELHTNLLDFKKGLDYFVNDTSFSQELRNELRIMAISVQLKMNALENKYKAEKSFFKPNINAGFTTGPTTGMAGTAVASAPTTPTTAVPTISTPGGRSKRRRTRQRKTRKSRR